MKEINALEIVFLLLSYKSYHSPFQFYPNTARGEIKQDLVEKTYLLGDCFFARAFWALPYFLLSFALGSRVKNPAFFKEVLKSGLVFAKALAIP